jgi:hypothetical protein
MAKARGTVKPEMAGKGGLLTAGVRGALSAWLSADANLVAYVPRESKKPDLAAGL